MNAHFLIFVFIFLLSVQIDFVNGSVTYKIVPEGHYKVVIYFRGTDEHGEHEIPLFTDEKGEFTAFQNRGERMEYSASKVYKIVIEKLQENTHQVGQSESKFEKGVKVGHGQHGHEKKNQKHVLNFNDNANGPDYLYPPDGQIVTINLAKFPASEF